MRLSTVEIATRMKAEHAKLSPQTLPFGDYLTFVRMLAFYKAAVSEARAEQEDAIHRDALDAAFGPHGQG